MKKVKIMLVAATVCAVVGGALAFKVKHDVTFYCTDAANQACTEADIVTSSSTFDNNVSKPFFCSTTITDDCPAVSLKFVN
jgi:hypothetical protein